MPGIVRTLKDGYWDHTTVIRTSEGTLRVRKESREAEAPGPWAREALRNEISYLKSIPEAAGDFFPPLLSSWDEQTIGYEIPYYQDRPDLARLLVAVSVEDRPAAVLVRPLDRLRHEPAPGVPVRPRGAGAPLKADGPVAVLSPAYISALG